MLYILLTCVLTLSQMFPTIFKSREISNFNQDMNHLIALPVTDVISGNTKNALTICVLLGEQLFGYLYRQKTNCYNAQHG